MATASGGAGGKFQRFFRRNAPATPYDRSSDALRNNSRSLLTKLVDPASTLIYAGAHRLYGALRKRLPSIRFQWPSETNEEPHDVPQEAERNVSLHNTDQGRISLSELEHMLKQTTFTRTEVRRLTALLYSRISDTTCNYNSSREMASPQQPNVMDKLPSDVLSKILIRLPAKQLAQMRSVCKPWNALLSQPSFIKSHLHRSIHNNDGVILLGFDLTGSGFDPFALNRCRSPHPELPQLFELPAKHPNEDSSGSVIGSVNGLVCFWFDNCNDHEHVIHIWNPSLSALLTLPPYTLTLPVDSYNFDYSSFEIHSRFGYDPKSDDYKLVKLTSWCPPYARLYNNDNIGTYFKVVRVSLQVEIYSVRKGSWEVIAQRFPSHITMIYDTDQVCVDGHGGHLHWLGFIGEEMKLHSIVAFDLGVETFREISLPDSFVGYDVDHRIVLGALTGKLCVMTRIKGGREFEVWVMDEYGVAKSWVRHCVSYLDSVLLPFGFTLNNEFLFKQAVDDDDYDDTRLVLYDPVKTRYECTYLDFTVHGDKSMWHVDSLVWVAPAKTITCTCSKHVAR